MRAHRLGVAARYFADVTVIGPVERRGTWPALPRESWIKTVTEQRFPRFAVSFLEMVDAAEGDVLLAVKPHLASFGVALVAAERRQVPVILDLDDWDVALAPRADWAKKPSMADLRRPASAVYLSLLTKATGAASAITVASTALQQRFGGTVVPHGALTELFTPGATDRDTTRRAFGFTGPTVLFAGTPRSHKGLKPLAKAVDRVPGARLAVLCRPEDLATKDWDCFRLQRIPMLSYFALPALLAAADVVAIPQLDTEAARHQMPMKVYDCMAMGRPIVASAVSDLPETLAGCARLVPPGDVEKLAEAITDLLTHPEEARRLGEAARARCLENYSMRRVAEKLFTAIGQVAPLPASSFVAPANRADEATRVANIPVSDTFGVTDDPKMWFLVPALTPAEAQPHLARCWAATSGPDSRLRLRAIRVARYKPARRCLIEYDVQLDGPPQPPASLTILGKAKAGEPDTASPELHRVLRAAGFGPDSSDGILVPEPLGMIPEFQMWLQRKVPGATAAEVLPTPAGVALAGRVAEAAHKLHEAGVPARRHHTMADELRLLREYLALVVQTRPQWASRLERLLAACDQLGGTVPEPRPCGIHRDFYPAQVLIDGPELYLVDFDLYCLGDPALDIGNFLGHMTEQSLRQFGDPRALAAQEQALQDRFAELAGQSCLPAIGAYATLTLARHVYLSTQFPERQPFTEALLELCEQRLGLA